MPREARLVTGGRVGRPHGLDGSFAVVDPRHPFAAGASVTIAGTRRRIERRAGTDERPLVRLEGIEDRRAAMALSGELLLVCDSVGEREWLAEELLGCLVEGLGRVRAVIPGPSCDVLELEDGTLVPLVADAVQRVDTSSRSIQVNLRFLGLGELP
jgi:16S rRNA processing protein RimM